MLYAAANSVHLSAALCKLCPCHSALLPLSVCHCCVLPFPHRLVARFVSGADVAAAGDRLPSVASIRSCRRAGGTAVSPVHSTQQQACPVTALW